MDYFEFYGLPESFSVDGASLKKKFYELSKRYHPDFFANEGEAKQQEILELSTLNNKAYQVLADKGKRMEYILQLHGLLADGDKYQLAPDFLMEMMDINEALTEAKGLEQINSIHTQITAAETTLNSKLDAQVSAYEEADAATARQTALKTIKDIYYRQKYLLRIKDTLNTFATRL